MLWNTLVLALRSIQRNLLRSFLTVLGIVIGVSAVITMVTLGSGATQAVQNQISSLGTNLLMIRPGQRMGPGGGGATAPPFKDSDVDLIKSQISGITAVAPEARAAVTLVAGGQNWSSSVVGSSNDWLHTGNWELAAGRAFTDGELRAGSQLLTEQVTINGTTFDYQVDANGFWQVHRQAPIALDTHVINLVNGQLQSAADAVIWDLYSGSGLFTLPLATMTGERTRMLSVEGARVAVKNAQRNLRAMNLNDVDARAGDVSRTLDHVPAHLAKPNVVVLDPPRAGARAKVCRQIAAAGASSVVYIACDPTSLARDTATLIGEGYELKDIRAFDIYPMTHHVETVALFTR